MKAIAAFAFAMTMSAPFAVAQKFEIQLDSVAAKAKEKAEVDLDSAMLAKAVKMDKKLEGVLGKVKEVHVRNFEFSEEGKYTEQDLEPLRRQTGAGSGWSHVVNVKDGKEHVEVLARVMDGKPSGFLVIAAEPKELSVVYIEGEVELDKMGELVNSTVKYDLKSLLNPPKAEEKP
jgi:hypothetical protein